MNGFIVLVQRVIQHSDADVPGGDTRGKGQCPVRQRVIDSAAGGGTARDRIVNGNRLARRCGKRDGQVDGGDILEGTGAGRVE